MTPALLPAPHGRAYLTRPAGRPPGPRPPASTPAAQLVAAALAASHLPTLAALARFLLAAGWEGATERSLLCALSRAWAGRRAPSAWLEAWLRGVAARGPAFTAADVVPPAPPAPSPSPELAAATLAGVSLDAYRYRRRVRGETHEQALDASHPRPRGGVAGRCKGADPRPLTPDADLIRRAERAAGAQTLGALGAALVAAGLRGPRGAPVKAASVTQRLSRARGGAGMPARMRAALRAMVRGPGNNRREE